LGLEAARASRLAVLAPRTVRVLGTGQWAVLHTVEDLRAATAIVDLVALDAQPHHSHLSVSPGGGKLLGALGLRRRGGEPRGQVGEGLLDVGSGVIGLGADGREHAIRGLRALCAAGLERVTELEVTGAIDAQRIGRPGLTRLNDRVAAQGRASGLGAVPEGGHRTGRARTSTHVDETRNEVRNLPLSRGEARTSSSPLRPRRELVPLARPPRPLVFPLLRARRGPIVADTTIAVLAVPGPAWGLLARHLAGTPFAILVVWALRGATGDRIVQAAIEALLGRRVISPVRVGVELGSIAPGVHVSEDRVARELVHDRTVRAATTSRTAAGRTSSCARRARVGVRRTGRNGQEPRKEKDNRTHPVSRSHET